MLDAVDHNHPIEHLFTADIKFNEINEKTLLFNEIYPPVFEKKPKKIEPFERSTVRIVSIVVKKDGKDEINSLPYNSNMHSTLKDQIFVTLYPQDLNFLVSRAGWLVTHIYAHYTFFQSKFKKDFVVMNQKSCQTASSKVEKDFYKLLNNSNFRIDCNNNIDNCYLEPIYDNIDEISYIKKYTNILTNQNYREFFSPDLIRREIEDFETKLSSLDKKS